MQLLAISTVIPPPDIGLARSLTLRQQTVDEDIEILTKTNLIEQGSAGLPDG